MELEMEVYKKIKEYPYLCKVCMERKIIEKECLDYNLKLEFCDYPNYCCENKLSIIFSDVQDFQMKNLDGLFRVCISINDLKERQLEKKKYFIKEEEEDIFSFYCSSIEIDIN